MEWLCLIFLLFKLVACQNMLVPRGYVMLSKESASNFFYILDKHRVCKVILNGKEVYYTIQDYSGSATKNSEWWYPKLKKRIPLEKCDSKPKPMLCYWNDGRPHIIVKNCNGDEIFYTPRINFATNLGFDILAYDYIKNQIYGYSDGKLYNATPDIFGRTSPDYTIKEIDTNSEWTDMLVVDGMVFYISEYNIYRYHDNGTSEKLSEVNNDVFPYTLIPEESLQAQKPDKISILAFLVIVFSIILSCFGCYKLYK